MGKSTLDRTGEQRPVLGKGHGTQALGPSDTSDSGSDASGTGERAAAGRDVEPGRDIKADRIETVRGDAGHSRRRRTLRSLRRRRNSKNV